MNEPIEDVYFNWLYTKVASVDVPTPSLTYWTLLRDLHATEFPWLVSGDDNRCLDGVELRREFNREVLIDYDPPWMMMGCSVLEMLIAFSRRAEFTTDISAREWFWIFLDNLGLKEQNDAQQNISEYVAVVLDRFIWRTYRPDGSGGMFPLRYPERDQREVEIWYQFCEYLVDQELV
jgi:hypothetical protein